MSSCLNNYVIILFCMQPCKIYSSMLFFSLVHNIGFGRDRVLETGLRHLSLAHVFLSDLLHWWLWRCGRAEWVCHKKVWQSLWQLGEIELSWSIPMIWIYRCRQREDRETSTTIHLETDQGTHVTTLSMMDPYIVESVGIPYRASHWARLS